MKGSKLFLCLAAIIGLALFMSLAVAMPASADSLKIGGTYTYPIYMFENAGMKGQSALTLGGGSIETDYLNGNKLAYTYCVEAFIDVYVNNTYGNTVVNESGDIYGKPLNHAGEVAWLLDHYGASGQGDKAYALQAAIWHVVTTGTTQFLTLDEVKSTPAQIALYNADLDALGAGSGSGHISNYYWMTPRHDIGGYEYQGLVAPVHAPIPPAVLLLGTGLVGLVGVRRRMR